MISTAHHNVSTIASALFVLLAGAGFCRHAAAQNTELQQRVTEVKESSAKNKQALASYSWTETVAISLKGELKKQEHFKVRLGPDLKPQKTSLDPPTDAAAPSGGRLKQHVVEKKKEEYKDYADQIKLWRSSTCHRTKICCSKPMRRGTSPWVRLRAIPMNCN